MEFLIACTKYCCLHFGANESSTCLNLSLLHLLLLLPGGSASAQNLVRFLQFAFDFVFPVAVDFLSARNSISVFLCSSVGNLSFSAVSGPQQSSGSVSARSDLWIISHEFCFGVSWNIINLVRAVINFRNCITLWGRICDVLIWLTTRLWSSCSATSSCWLDSSTWTWAEIRFRIYSRMSFAMCP